MSRKISVTGESRHVSKNAALSLLHRLLYVWDEPRHSIRRASVAEYRAANAQQAPVFFIPDNLPPRELPGLRFVLNARSWELPAIAPADLEQPSRAVMRA